MPCFMGFLAFFMLTECVFEGFPPNSCRPHPDIEQSDVFFFFSVQWAEPFSTCKNTWELSYLGILFRLLTLAIQGGLETLGHKDTVCTGGLAPLQWEHTCVTQNPTHKPTPSPQKGLKFSNHMIIYYIYFFSCSEKYAFIHI